MDFIVGLPRT
jgi:transposase InsO family protein